MNDATALAKKLEALENSFNALLDCLQAEPALRIDYAEVLNRHRAAALKPPSTEDEAMSMGQGWEE